MLYPVPTRAALLSQRFSELGLVNWGFLGGGCGKINKDLLFSMVMESFVFCSI